MVPLLLLLETEHGTGRAMQGFFSGFRSEEYTDLLTRLPFLNPH